MIDDYTDYKTQKAKKEDEISFYRLMLETIAPLLGAKNGVIREMLKHSLRELFMIDSSSDLQKKTSKVEQIRGLVTNKFMFTPDQVGKSVTSTAINKAIEDARIRDLDFLEYSSLSDGVAIAGAIASNPVETFCRYLDDYIRAVIELITIEEKYYNMSLDHVSSDTVQRSNVDIESKDINADVTVSITDEDQLDTMIESIKKLINTPEMTFTPSEEIRVKNNLDGSPFLIPDTGELVCAGIKVQRIKKYYQAFDTSRKGIFRKNEVLTEPGLYHLGELASLILTNLPKELLMADQNQSKAALNSKKLRDVVGMEKSLEVYSYCYEVCMTYINSLPPDRQDEILGKRYSGWVGSELPTPEELKDLVNLEVKNEMIRNYLDYFMYGTFISDKIANSCKLMTEEEMAALYVNIKKERNKYSHNEDKATKGFEVLQRNFAWAILIKRKQNKLDDKEINEKLKEIVREVLHEDLLFTLPEVNETKTEEKLDQAAMDKDGKYHYIEDGKEKVTTSHVVAAKYNAKQRFFGMSKLEQTMARMTGKWRRLLELEEKALEVSETDQERIAQELDSMFRK